MNDPGANPEVSSCHPPVGGSILDSRFRGNDRTRTPRCKHQGILLIELKKRKMQL